MRKLLPVLVVMLFVIGCSFEQLKEPQTQREIGSVAAAFVIEKAPETANEILELTNGVVVDSPVVETIRQVLLNEFDSTLERECIDIFLKFLDIEDPEVEWRPAVEGFLDRLRDEKSK